MLQMERKNEKSNILLTSKKKIRFFLKKNSLVTVGKSFRYKYKKKRFKFLKQFINKNLLNQNRPQNFLNVKLRSIYLSNPRAFSFINRRFLKNSLKQYFVARKLTVSQKTIELRKQQEEEAKAQAQGNKDKNIKKKDKKKSFKKKKKFKVFKGFSLETKKFKQRMSWRILSSFAHVNKSLRQRVPLIVGGFYLIKLARLFKMDLSYYLKQKVALKFTFIYNNTITTQILLSYILDKLEKLYIPREFVPHLLRKFEGTRPFFNKKNDFVPRRLGIFGKYTSGIMVKCAGRFSRAQMASRMTFQKGDMPLSTIRKNIKYSFGALPLKYGVLGIKVFLVKTNNE